MCPAGPPHMCGGLHPVIRVLPGHRYNRAAMRHLARLAVIVLALSSVAAVSASASTAGRPYSFVSAPRLHPPKLKVLERRAGLAQGDFLVAGLDVTVSPGLHAVGQTGPMILDSHARPIWFRTVAGRGGEILDFDQETYRGKPVLVWAQGRTVVVVNQRYRRIATLHARAPWAIDGHDASIVGGDVWVTVTRLVGDQNLTAYGGPREGTVIDCGVQEYQLATGRRLMTWDALNPGGAPKVPLSASEQSLNRGAWDAYHLNAVQPLPNGNLLVSMRNTWAVYLIDPVSGQILWALGGKRSSFTVGQGAQFAWQHDARLVRPAQGGQGAHVELTLFNDDCCGMTSRGQPGHAEGPSEGMVLDLNTLTDTAALAASYSRGPSGHSGILGSMELLPGGNALVGWGSQPYFSEYSSSGRQLLDVRWPGGDQSYRALFTDTWVGTPYYPPSGAVRGRTVYASWNGATQVSRWEVLAGSRGGRLAVVAGHTRTGFETALRVSRRYGAYRVRALSAQGKVLGSSKPFS